MRSLPISLQDYIRRHDYLICIDSDGCVVDTMEKKHKRCFGPCMAEEWKLEKHILMVGAAPGYKAAAELNGINCYPIHVRQEIKSWEEFPEAVQRLKDGMYHEYGCRMSEKFLVNLSVEEI